MIIRAVTRFATLAVISALFLTAPSRTAVAQTATAPGAPITAASTPDTTTLPDCVAGARDGAALAAKGYGWSGRLFIVGVLTNVFGAAVIIPVAAISSPSVPPREREKIMGRSVAYQTAFERTHNRKAWQSACSPPWADRFSVHSSTAW